MSLLGQLRKLVDDPPPAYAFEISQGGIAFSARGQAKSPRPAVEFHPLPQDVLAISPVKDNVERPDVLLAAVRAIEPANGGRKRREAALILPDYCARVAVLDFESFPSDANEQLALVRFRMKRTVPFDLEEASISFHARPAGGRKHEVVVAATPHEVVAHFEAPFRQAGFLPGFVTTSMLAAMDLLPQEGYVVAAKLATRVLTVAVADGRHLKMLRCVELAELSAGEVLAVLFPTFAYAEDELPARPSKLLLCGFGAAAESFRQQCEADLQVEAAPLRSYLGTPDETNAGLHGYLQACEGN